MSENHAFLAGDHLERETRLINKRKAQNKFTFLGRCFKEIRLNQRYRIFETCIFLPTRIEREREFRI